jgi:hypothetical protein
MVETPQLENHDEKDASRSGGDRRPDVVACMGGHNL